MFTKYNPWITHVFVLSDVVVLLLGRICHQVSFLLMQMLMRLLFACFHSVYFINISSTTNISVFFSERDDNRKTKLNEKQDAATIAAADEANPMLHPDTLRRKRTLRDAGLAAKAAFSSTTPSNAAATGNSGGVSGSGRSSALSQSAPRPRLMSGEDAGDASERGPAPNTAKMALRTSRYGTVG